MTDWGRNQVNNNPFYNSLKNHGGNFNQESERNKKISEDEMISYANGLVG